MTVEQDEELESKMMSIDVREIFNIVKCCIVREISRRETGGHEGVHT